MAPLEETWADGVGIGADRLTLSHFGARPPGSPLAHESCMTQVLQVDAQQPEPELIAQAAAVIRQGGLVAFPTETVYGLGANALSAAAVSRIFVAKERPEYDPLIVHIAEVPQLRVVAADVPEVLRELASVFWPGPLTLVMAKGPEVPREVTAGGETVAVRLPAHPVALALIRAAGVPIAAPSANRFGRVSPTRAEHVLNDLGGRVDLILDAGSTSVGVESTVLSLIAPVPTILRPGGVSREALERVLGTVVMASQTVEDGGPLLSPGTTAKHYAPAARVILYRGERNAVLATMREAARQYLESGEKVGLLVADEDLESFADLPLVRAGLGSLASLDAIAHRLYASLRGLDASGVTMILARDFGSAGLGLAIRDRLTRAAAGRVVIVDR